jgi:hypothetical protein
VTRFKDLAVAVWGFSLAFICGTSIAGVSGTEWTAALGVAGILLLASGLYLAALWLGRKRGAGSPTRV